MGGLWEATKTDLAKVHLIEYDLVGVTDAPETGHKGKNRDDDEGDLVVALLVLLDLALVSLGQLAVVGLDRCGRVGLLSVALSLAQTARRRRARHDMLLVPAMNSQSRCIQKSGRGQRKKALGSRSPCGYLELPPLIKERDGSKGRVWTELTVMRPGAVNEGRQNTQDDTKRFNEREEKEWREGNRTTVTESAGGEAGNVSFSQELERVDMDRDPQNLGIPIGDVVRTLSQALSGIGSDSGSGP